MNVYIYLCGRCLFVDVVNCYLNKYKMFAEVKNTQTHFQISLSNMHNIIKFIK